MATAKNTSARQARLRDVKYEYWVKATLGLSETKKLLEPYVEEKFKQFVFCQLPANSPLYLATFDQQERTHQREHPLKDYAKWDRQGKRWSFDLTKVKNAQKCLCQNMFNKIIRIKHQLVRDERMSFGNCTTVGQNLYWDVAKVFMGDVNPRNVGSKGATDIDVTALCQVLLNCDLFSRAVHRQSTEQVRESRNSLFHSSKNELYPNEYQQFFINFDTLLANVIRDQEVTQATKTHLQNGRDEIIKLEKSELGVSVFEEADKALREKKKAVEEDFHDMITKHGLDEKEWKQFSELFESIGQDLVDWNALKTEEEMKIIHQSEVDELNKKVDESNEALKNKTSELELQINALENVKADLKSKLKDKDSEIKDLNDTNQQLQSDLWDKKEAMQHLEKKLQQHEHAYSELQELVREKETTITDLKSQIKNLKADVNSLKDLLESLKSDQDAFKTEISELNNKLQTRDRKIEEQKQKIDVLKADLKRAGCKIKSLNDQLEKSEREKSQLQTKNEKLHRDKEELNIQKRDLLIQIVILSKLKDIHRKTTEEHSSQIAVHETKAQSLKTERDNLEQTLKGEIRENYFLKRQLQGTKLKIERLERKYRDLSKDVPYMKNDAVASPFEDILIIAGLITLYVMLMQNLYMF